MWFHKWICLFLCQSVVNDLKMTNGEIFSISVCSQNSEIEFKIDVFLTFEWFQIFQLKRIEFSEKYGQLLTKSYNYQYDLSCFLFTSVSKKCTFVFSGQNKHKKQASRYLNYYFERCEMWVLARLRYRDVKGFFVHDRAYFYDLSLHHRDDIWCFLPSFSGHF